MAARELSNMAELSTSGTTRVEGSGGNRDSIRFSNHTKNVSESMDFEEMESIMWRKHQLRRFFQDRGQWWTNSRRTTAWKWVLVVATGVFIGIIGYFVSFLTAVFTDFKFSSCNDMIDNGDWGSAFVSFLFFCLFYSFLAGILCWIEPAAVGSGIPEIKSYLNGINLNKVVRIRVLFAKVLGMCLSVASGLPLGKEGPMIHSGSIVGAAVSQGKTITFGLDTSWTKFQDVRNDRSKRDYVTFGAAAGVAAAFSAPIGGILFTLEEGASFWSTTLTFRAFFCAMVTQLTLSLLYNGFQLGQNQGYGLFAFGLFDDFSGYSTYELFIFAGIGVAGGFLGAFFNHLNMLATLYRGQYAHKMWKRMVDLLVLTLVMAIISFVLPLMWDLCTPVPTNTADWTAQEVDLLDDLVQFQCKSNHYNQLASLYFTSADTAMQQLFHFKEVDGTTYTTFSTGALLLFFVPYYFMAAVTSGTLCPAGLFVPMLVAGAAFGRTVGHILNCAAPGFVTDAGSYALIGSAALLGGMSRMTIAGTIIILEACGNSAYLLPLMVTFAAARYTGNAINQPMYDMHIHLKELPFLEGALKTLGLLNYHPVAEFMAQPVVTLHEINRVGTVHHLLATKTHNGFPVVDKAGHLRGFILRKTLTSIIKLKAFSTPVPALPAASRATGEAGGSANASVQLAPAATVFYDTLERNYPHYPKIEDITLTAADMNCYLDIRPYMDTAPYSINASSSLSRAYRLFRTMGLRHLIVLDNDHRVTGILTRKDLTEHRLEHHWVSEGDNMQKFINVDPMEPGMIAENTGLLQEDEETGTSAEVDLSMNPLALSGGGHIAQFEVSTRSVSGDVGYLAPEPTTPPPPGASAHSTSMPAPATTSRTREQRAMKEPRSLRK